MTWLMMPFYWTALFIEWVVQRPTAKHCPKCGSWWRTEKFDAFMDYELWACNRCKDYFKTPRAGR